MKRIKIICPVCGNTDYDSQPRSGRRRICCSRRCARKNWQKRNLPYLRIYNHLAKQRFPEYFLRKIRTYNLKHSERLRKKRLDCSKELGTRYVLSLLSHNSNLKHSDFPPEIVEIKRKHITALRLIRKKQTKCT